MGSRFADLTPLEPRTLLDAAGGALDFPSISPTEFGARVIAVGDLNGDNLPDVVGFSNNTTEMSLQFNLGNGRLGLESNPVDLGGSFQPGFGVVITDIDDDGDNDIIVPNTDTSRIHVIRNSGTGQVFTTAFFADGAAGTGFYDVAVGDVNKYGNLDIVAAEQNESRVATFLGDGTGAFAQPVYTNVGGAPRSVALADLDGDGRLDLITPNSNSDEVFIRRGENSASLFANANQTFTVGNNPFDVVVADVDGDGDGDIATADAGDAAVTFLPNTSSSGSISFGSGQQVSVSGSASFIAAGDIDRDGFVDLVAGESILRAGADGIRAAETNGSNTQFDPALFADMNADNDLDLVGAVTGGSLFGTGVAFNFGNGVFNGITRELRGAATDVATGDFNGDGRPDTVTVQAGSEFALVRFNLGDGVLGLANEITVGSGFSGKAVLAFDIDGDGDTDIIAADGSTSFVHVLLNSGSGEVFTSAAYSAAAAGSGFADLAFGDVNQDGNLDIAASESSTSSGLVFLSDGSGALAQPVQFSMGSGAQGIILADLDGDGRLDLATADPNDSTVSIRLGVPGGDLFSNSRETFNVGSQPRYLASGDIDNDSDLDIAVTDSNSTEIKVLRNASSAGSLSFPDIRGFETNNVSDGVASGDIDGDGFDDIIAGLNGGERTGVLRGGADGVRAVEVYSINPIMHPALADFDNDGDLDVAGSSTSSGLVLNLNYGQNLTHAPRFTISGQNQVLALATGDFNGDGLPDLVSSQNSQSTVTIQLNLGSGVFGPPVTTVTVGNGANTSYGLEVADIDGDGDIDILATEFDSNTLYVLRNAGTGQVFTVTNVSDGTNNGFGRLVAVDLNDDGNLDVVTSEFDGSRVAVFLGDGTGAFAQPQYFSAGNGVFGVAVADLDGDGRLDVAATNFNDDSITVFRGVSSGILDSGQTFNTGGNSPVDIVALDLDGDGKRDLVAAEANGQQLVVFTNTSTSGSISLSSPAYVRLGFSAFSLRAGDLDNDGDLDMVIGGFANNFGGIAYVGPSGIESVESFQDFLALDANPADVDGDGDLDLITSNYTFNPFGIQVALNPTMGAFSPSNQRPTINSAVSIGNAKASKAITISYNDLAGSANDSDGDSIRFVVQAIINGTLTKNGSPVVPGETTLGPGEALVWTPGSGANGATNAFTVRASDGNATSEGTATVTANVDSVAVQNAQLGQGRTPHQAYTASGGLVVGALNDNGAFNIYHRASESAPWMLQTFGDLGALTDPVVFTTARNAKTYVALATANGLMIFEDSGDGTPTAWSNTANLTTALGAENIASSLTTMTSVNGYALIAGLNSGGQVVLYQETASGAWVSRNLSTADIAGRGLTTPALTGNLVGYVTPWNGLNLAGLDANGRVHSVWWAPGLGSWTTSDLSTATGTNIELEGGLSVYVTGWGGINITGVNASGDLVVVWWSPGRDWTTTNFSDALFEGVQLDKDSVQSYATPWNSLHIIGIDNNGALRVFWWGLADQTWRTADFGEVLPASDPINPETVHTAVGVNGEQAIFAGSPSDDLLGFSWTPQTEWQYSNLTDAVV